MTPRERKDSDSSDSRKTFINYSYAFTCSVDSFGFFFPFFPPSVVYFIGTMKSN